MDLPVNPRRAIIAPGNRILRIAAIVVAVALQLVVLVPFTLASGLVAPLWAVIALHALWLAASGLLLVLARRRPLFAPLVPVVNAAVLWAAITLGETVLGWTA